jgi:hypothetical protein
VRAVRRSRRTDRQWEYPSAFDRISWGGLIGTLSPSLEVPARAVRWSCAPRELSLELELPEDDEAADRASAVLGDIVSALPSQALDPKADQMKIVVAIQTGDSAIFDPKLGASGPVDEP